MEGEMGVGWEGMCVEMGVVWVWDRERVCVEMCRFGGSKNLQGESVYGVERSGEKEVCTFVYEVKK